MNRRRLGLGLFALGNGALSMALMALAAFATRQPLIFPSLGPTAFVLFYVPRAPAACPRNTLCGHAIGLGAGYLSLIAFGLEHAPPALSGGVTLPWVGAAALSLGVTSGLMVWLGVPHPPAGATTLIVALGILPKPVELLTLFASVVALVAQGVVINRLAGVPYPLWRPLPSATHVPAHSPEPDR